MTSQRHTRQGISITAGQMKKNPELELHLDPDRHRGGTGPRGNSRIMADGSTHLHQYHLLHGGTTTSNATASSISRRDNRNHDHDRHQQQSACPHCAHCQHAQRGLLQSPPDSPSPAATEFNDDTITAAPLSTPASKATQYADGLSEQIARLQRSDWVSLEGLVSVAVERLGKAECVAISELGIGSLNSLYQLEFSDGSSCAASIPNSPPQFFCANAKKSEIATMQYLSSSPRYRIPVPRVYDWDLTFENPVGAPYILREVVIGRNIARDGRFYSLSFADKLKVIKELARVQAELSKPAEFKQIGCLYQREDNPDEFYVGKMISFPSGSEEEDSIREQFSGPFDSLTDLWEARIERETLSAINNWSELPSDNSIPSQLDSLLLSSKANPQEFGELLQLLSGLTSLFTPPTEFSSLCIHHSDLAIRNVLFSDDLKITGVIDWEFASVMPLVVTGRFPDDLGWEGNEFARRLGKLGTIKGGESWDHHYYDWTSLAGVSPPLKSELPSPPLSPSMEDYLTTLNATANQLPPPYGSDADSIFSGSCSSSPPSPPLPPPPTSETTQEEINKRTKTLVSLFYLRKQYAGYIAQRNFRLTSLFMDSVAYVKFNEVVMGGAEKWFRQAEWIKELYYRMQNESYKVRERLSEGRGVIRIPEVLNPSPEIRGVVDLGR